MHVFIITDKSEAADKLRSELDRQGFTCSVFPSVDDAVQRVAEQKPDLVLAEMNGNAETRDFLQTMKQEKEIPALALVSRKTLYNTDSIPDIDDFILEPFEAKELALRIRRLLNVNGTKDSRELIRYRDLTIDLARCEVYVGGRPVMLTFKEYELLKFLINNKGRVFTRETLLNKVWGYDYYGGDRTVDVHIRRLRSKLEDSSHTFFDTVRNIGYRFRDDDSS